MDSQEFMKNFKEASKKLNKETIKSQGIVLYEKDANYFFKLVDRDTPIKPKKIFQDHNLYRYECPICNTQTFIGYCCVNNDCRQRIDWIDEQ